MEWMELKIHDFEGGNRSPVRIICFPSHAAEFEMPSFRNLPKRN